MTNEKIQELKDQIADLKWSLEMLQDEVKDLRRRLDHDGILSRFEPLD